jgi:Holliday junction resolvasome RuvABC ATP-dependent DNA helicase subunit
MPLPLLENVFKLSGVPTHTFVKATEYDRLFVALRTSGRGVVIEGPSGIGKTTAVAQALTELDGLDSALRLSARSADDRDFIAELPSLRDAGPVVIDDFHRLEEPLRRRIADFLKVLADEERTDSKLIVVGINKAGDSLVSFAPDLSTRIDIIRLEANPDKSVRELIEKGERALNVAIGAQNSIVHEANGSFFLAQMLCHNLCLEAHVTEAHDSEKPRRIAMGFERVRARVMDELS